MLVYSTDPNLMPSRKKRKKSAAFVASLPQNVRKMKQIQKLPPGVDAYAVERRIRWRRLPPVKDSPEYAQLWRVIDGAVRDLINAHPEYFVNTQGRQMRAIRESICKRVTGAVVGYLNESFVGSDEGPIPARSDGQTSSETSEESG